MQKIILLLVSVLLVFSLVSCKSKMSEDETTVGDTSAYDQVPSGNVTATTDKDSLVGEITSVIDDVTSVVDDIIDDVTPDNTEATTK